MRSPDESLAAERTSPSLSSRLRSPDGALTRSTPVHRDWPRKAIRSARWKAPQSPASTTRGRVSCMPPWAGLRSSRIQSGEVFCRRK